MKLHACVLWWVWRLWGMGNAYCLCLDIVCTFYVLVYVFVLSMSWYTCLYCLYLGIRVCTVCLGIRVCTVCVLVYVFVLSVSWYTCLYSVCLDIHICTVCVLIYIFVLSVSWYTCLYRLCLDIRVCTVCVLIYIFVLSMSWYTCLYCLCLGIRVCTVCVSRWGTNGYLKDFPCHAVVTGRPLGRPGCRWGSNTGILNECSCKAWTLFILFGVGTNSRLLWMRQWT
jgi:hypothetical protein